MATALVRHDMKTTVDSNCKFQWLFICHSKFSATDLLIRCFDSWPLIDTFFDLVCCYTFPVPFMLSLKWTDVLKQSLGQSLQSFSCYLMKTDQRQHTVYMNFKQRREYSLTCSCSYVFDSDFKTPNVSVLAHWRHIYWLQISVTWHRQADGLLVMSMETWLPRWQTVPDSSRMESLPTPTPAALGLCGTVCSCVCLCVCVHMFNDWLWSHEHSPTILIQTLLWSDERKRAGMRPLYVMLTAGRDG